MVSLEENVRELRAVANGKAQREVKDKQQEIVSAFLLTWTAQRGGGQNRRAREGKRVFEQGEGQTGAVDDQNQAAVCSPDGKTAPAHQRAH